MPDVWFDMHSNPDAMKIEYAPIGEFHTQLTPQSGAPRQGILQPGNRGTIEIFDEYTAAIEGLENFEYIIVLYHMHLSRHWHADVRPPGSKRSFGLFATRSPNRPNPIGFAVIRLNRVEGTVLHVSGIDAYDGTPVLDIKPWLQSIDCPVNKSTVPIERELGLEK